MRYVVAVALIAILVAFGSGTEVRADGNAELSGGMNMTILFDTPEGARRLPGVTLEATYWPDYSEGHIFFWQAYMAVGDADYPADYTFTGVGYNIVEDWWGLKVSGEAALGLDNFTEDVGIGAEAGFRFDYSLNGQPFSGRIGYINLDGYSGVVAKIGFKAI